MTTKSYKYHGSQKARIFCWASLAIFTFSILCSGHYLKNNNLCFASAKKVLSQYRYPREFSHEGKEDGSQINQLQHTEVKGEDGGHQPGKTTTQRVKKVLQNSRKVDRIQNTNPSINLVLQNLTYLTLMQMQSPKFLKDYTAPCVKVSQNDRRSGRSGKNSKVMCLPAVYLAGQPKCGSTDLYDHLTQHPDIIRIFKEPQYWSRKRFHPGREKLSYYLNIYGNASKEIQGNCIKVNNKCIHKKLFIDGSVSLLWDNSRWPLMPGNSQQRVPRIINAHHIRHLTPNIKIIIIFRDPVDREYSSYLYFSRSKVSPEDFHWKVLGSIRKFNNCSKIFGARACTYNMTLMQTLPLRLYISLYSIFVNDWLKIFPRGQFYFLRLEDYKENRAKYIQEILRFLEVDEPPSEFYKLKSVSNQRRPGTESVGAMLPKTRKLLKDFFQPFNRRLARILNNNDFLYS